MKATFYDLMAYAHTGIASDRMTEFDKARAIAMCGSGMPVNTISGAPPISFQSDGSALTAWTISGASGGVGDRTANLFDKSTAAEGYYINDDNGVRSYSDDTSASDYIDVSGMENISISNTDMKRWGAFYDAEKVFVSGFNGYGTVAVQEGAKYARLTIRNAYVDEFMVNEGTTLLPYVPYGYEIPITCGGTTKTVYLDAPLGASDSVSMADTGITINPESGENTLSIGTTVQPESVSITGHITQ